ncbi:hypothetical protein THRCLA_02471 [Thraustotheca clavata]|uniref:Uncharacterized protein n=1 Tax=Thraustotheca clavata TaxID=74557 RepID=A0A1W0A529_9STRA|nr:hypothetical protein THRCLA_02471 [Thraustotheca clavata]
MEECTNSSAYKFGVLRTDELPLLRQALLDKAKEISPQLFGTILLTEEGLNIRLSGPNKDVLEMQKFMNTLHPNIGTILFKDSYTKEPTLRKFLVRIKKEVISMGMPSVQPAVDGLAVHISPNEFKTWMDNDKDMLILDTRNDYEVRLGTFENAVDLDIKSFRVFPQVAKEKLQTIPKDKPIVMFCTGGVRCEKASYALLQEGYQNVYQLDGGILKYFEECGGAHYNGDCYIYDDRVALTPSLTKSQDIGICFVCRQPLTKEERNSPEFVSKTSCPYCIGGKRAMSMHEEGDRSSSYDGMTMERLLQAEKSVLKAGQATLEAWNMMTINSKKHEDAPPIYSPDHMTEMQKTLNRHSSYAAMAPTTQTSMEDTSTNPPVHYTARGSFTIDSMENQENAYTSSTRKNLPALNVFGMAKSMSSVGKSEETTHTFTVKKADNFLIDNLSKRSSVRISIDTESRMLAFLSPTSANEKEEYSCAAITAKESSKLGLHLNIQQGQAPPITRKIAFFCLDDRQRFMEALEFGKIKYKSTKKTSHTSDSENFDEMESVWDSTQGSYSMPDTETELDRLPGEEINQKVQRVTNLVIIAQKERAVQGELVMTNYRVVFMPYDPSLQYGSFEVPLAAINLTKFEGMKIIIFCKDLRKICLSMHDAVAKKIAYHDMTGSQPAQGHWIQMFMSKLRPPLSVNSVFAFTYHHAKRAGMEIPRDQDGWLVYSPVEEYKRLGFLEHTNGMPWRLLKNTKFLFSPTYPQLMVVPFNLDKDQLVSSVKFRSRGRLPIAVWRHPDNKCVLARSSQPMYGIQSKRCEADRQLLKAYRDAANKNSAGLAPPLHIVDARKVIATQGNRLVGKGVEQSSHYDNAVVEFLGIANIHKMRDSIEALQNLVHPTITDDGHKEFHSALHDTRWLKHIMKILSGGSRIAQILHEEGASVLVHCSDGWDRTPQLCGIAELILDPHYRTIRGFAALVEKEWCSFGHKFHDRIGVGKDALDLANERSPVFLQFLDAVWQMTRQFPTAFEFNERFLLHVVDSIFSGLYGTFLFNTEKERADNTMWQRTESVWTSVLDSPAKYTNANYQQTTRVLYPRANLKRVVLWEALFFRWDPEMHPAYVESLDPLSKAKETKQAKQAQQVDTENLRIAESFASTTPTLITDLNDNSDGSSFSDNEDEEYRPARRQSIQKTKSTVSVETKTSSASLSPDRETVANLQQTLAQYPQQATERARQRSKDSSLREALEMVPDKTRIRYLEQLLSQKDIVEMLGEHQPLLSDGSRLSLKGRPPMPPTPAKEQQIGLSTLAARQQLLATIEDQLECSRHTRNGCSGDASMWLLLLCSISRFAAYGWNAERRRVNGESPRLTELLEGLFLAFAALLNGLLSLTLAKRERKEVAERVRYAVKVLYKAAAGPTSPKELKKDSKLSPSSCYIACYRDGIWQSIPMNLLVNGDVIALMSGDVVPGQVRLLYPTSATPIVYSRGTKVNAFSSSSGPRELPRLDATFQPDVILHLCGDMHVFVMEETPVLKDIYNSIFNVYRPSTAIQTLQNLGQIVGRRICLVFAFLVVGSIVTRALLLPEPIHHAINHMCLGPVGLLLCFVSLHTPFVWFLGEAAATAHLLTAFEGILESEQKDEYSTAIAEEDMDVYDVEEREQLRLNKSQKHFALERNWYYFWATLKFRFMDCAEAHRTRYHNKKKSKLTIPYAGLGLLERLGSTTMLCCFDDDILCDESPCVEEIFLLNDEPSNMTVLDLHPESLCSTGLKFEDPKWRAHLSSLKPIGLAILLNDYENPRSQYHTTLKHLSSPPPEACLSRQTDIQQCLLELSGHVRLLPSPRHLLNLSTEIGFQPADLANFQRKQSIHIIAPRLAIEEHTTDHHAQGQEDTRYRGYLKTHLYSNIVMDKRSHGHQLLSRGHPSLVVSQCGEYWDGKSICPLTADKRRLILDMYQQWKVEDLDCVALTYAPVAHKFNSLFKKSDGVLPPVFLVEDNAAGELTLDVKQQLSPATETKNPSMLILE